MTRKASKSRWKKDRIWQENWCKELKMCVGGAGRCENTRAAGARSSHASVQEQESALRTGRGSWRSDRQLAHFSVLRRVG
jgi:hypothetical protein